jgi:hypothetical protein
MCAIDGPRSETFDSSLPELEWDPIDFLSPAVRHLRSIVPRSVGLNVLYSFLKNNWKEYPLYGMAYHTLPSLAASRGATVQTFKYLIDQGATLDFDPRSVFLTRDYGSPTVLSSLAKWLLTVELDTDPAVSSLEYLLENPSCNWNVFEDNVIVSLLRNPHPKVWKLGIDAARQHLSRADIPKHHAATLFSIPSHEGCNLLSAVLDADNVPLQAIKFLLQPENGPALFGIDVSSCSAFHHDPKRNFSADVVALLKRFGALPNLTNHQDFTTIEWLVSKDCPQAINVLVSIYGVPDLVASRSREPGQLIQRLVAPFFRAHSAFTDTQMPYLIKHSMLVLSSMLTVKEMLVSTLKALRCSPDHRAQMSARAELYFILKNGFLRTSSDRRSVAALWDQALTEMRKLGDGNIVDDMDALVQKLLVDIE